MLRITPSCARLGPIARGAVGDAAAGRRSDYWRTRHVDYHHVYANVEHYDLDTEENGFFRQTPFQRWRPHMRYQHLYWPLIAALATLHRVDFRLVRSAR